MKLLELKNNYGNYEITLSTPDIKEALELIEKLLVPKVIMCADKSFFKKAKKYSKDKRTL